MLILCALCAFALVAMVVLCLVGSGGSSNRDLEKRLEQRAEDQARGHVPSSVAPSDRAGKAMADPRVSTTTP